MENKVSYYAIATTYVGTMFGAGFISGQELLQFFGCDPSHSIYGAIILGFLILIFSFIVMHSSYIKQPASFEKLIVRDNKYLKYLVNFLFLFFSCGVLIIMFAGAGALLNTLFDFPSIIGALLMMIIVLFIALNDTDGIIKAFKVLTPIMFILALTTSLLGINLDVATTKEMLVLKCPGNSWWFSAILYMAYNNFLAIAILAPLGKNAKSKKEIIKGAILSSIILFIISLALILAINHNYNLIIYTEMPMLTIANTISPLMGNIYAFVLFGGLLSASIGMLFAILNHLGNTNNKILSNRKITVPFLCVCAVALSSFGFSHLISIVYPILGYIGIFAIIAVIINYKKS